VSINVNRNLPNLSAVAADNYLDGAGLGARLWQTAMARHASRSFPLVTVSTNNSSAPIQLTVVDTPLPGSESGAFGSATLGFGTVAGRTVITDVQIRLHRPALAGAETLLRNRVWSPLQFNALITQVVAHEMGHALGIRSHSLNAMDLMAAGGNRQNGESDIDNWISTADALTLSHAYCQ